MGRKTKDFDRMDAAEQYRLIWQEHLADRPGADELMRWMEFVEFEKCPASAGYHLSFPGGWCTHSVNVVMNAVDLCELPAFAGADQKEAVVAALLHDLCKLGKYREGKDGKYRYEDSRMLGHGEESVILAMRFIELTPNETLAIRWHMGAYTGEKDWKTLGKAYDTHPLTMLLHFADMMATHVDEV